MDPKNHEEVIEIAGKMIKAPPERFDWLFTKQDYYRNPDMLPDLKALQANIDRRTSSASSRRRSTCRNTPTSASSRRRPSA